MSDVVIQAENLGKKYVIGHQTESGRYTALRDVLVQNVRSLWRKTRDLVQGKPIIQGDELEEVWALKDVSFEIQRGEAVGIIGRNGAGKSTLLKILSRITEPSTGRVTIKGRVASLLEVGTGFHPELTGRENIYLNGAVLGMTRQEIKRKFDEIVAFAEVEKYLDTPVKRYSSGMYVRLAFAVAAHLEPEILVVDEVLAVGDSIFQKKCLGKMKDVATQGRTVLFVSHNMAAINTLTSRCLLLNAGQIQMSGDPTGVTSRYLSYGLAENQKGVIDLTEGYLTRVVKSNHDPTGDIVLAKLELINSKGDRTNQFLRREPIRFCIYFDVRRPFKYFMISLTVSTMGTRVFRVKTARLEWCPKPGIYSISTIFCPNYLTEGIYSLSMGIFTTSFQDGGYEMASFEIVSDPDNPEIDEPMSGSPGLVDFGYTWDEPVRE